MMALAIFWSACDGGDDVHAWYAKVCIWFCCGLLLNVFLFVAMFVYMLAVPGRCCGDAGRQS